MVECFKPFLRELLALSMSRKTLHRHRDGIVNLTSCSRILGRSMGHDAFMLPSGRTSPGSKP
jgi:hypothetical protein